jgi:WD40 repeat protein
VLVVKKLFLFLLLLIAALPAAAQEMTLPEGAQAFPVPMNPNGYNMEVSPDGQIAAIFENNALLGDMPDLFTIPIRLFNLETGEEMGALAGHSDFAVDFDFSPDGTHAASIHTNGDIHIWDIEAQDSVQRFKLLLLGGGRIEFLDDGQTLVVLVGGLSSRLFFFDTETGAITRIVGRHFLQYNDFRENYTSAPGSFDLMYVAFAVSADGSTAAVATANDEVILFNVETGRETTIREPAEEMGQLRIRRMEFIENGTQLLYVAQGDPTTVHLWDVESGEEVFSSAMGSVSWDYRNGLFAWVEREDSTLHVIDLETSNVLVEESLGDGITPLTVVALTPGAVIIGSVQSEADEGNVLLKIALEAGN